MRARALSATPVGGGAAAVGAAERSAGARAAGRAAQDDDPHLGAQLYQRTGSYFQKGESRGTEMSGE